MTNVSEGGLQAMTIDAIPAVGMLGASLVEVKRLNS